MQHQATSYGYALRLDSGEEIVAGLRDFARRQSVRAAALLGLGALGECELGFYVRGTGSYVRRAFTGEFEIGSLVGNLADFEGEPFPHCHVVIAGEDFVAHTGHLFRGVVSVTCEIQVIRDPGVLRRVRRPEVGYLPLELSP
jgi:predicted DNA-binding protein with PD1-like motif